MSSNDPIILTNGWRPKRVPEPHYPYVFAVGVLQRIWVAAERDFEDRRQQVIPTLQRHFKVVRKIAFPPVLGAAGILRLYSGLLLVNRD